MFLMFASWVGAFEEAGHHTDVPFLVLSVAILATVYYQGSAGVSKARGFLMAVTSCVI